MLAGSGSAIPCQRASNAARLPASRRSPRAATSPAQTSSGSSGSSGSRTIVSCRSGRSFLTARIFSTWPRETTAIRQPECRRRNFRADASSILTEIGTFTAPQQRMPSSATTQSFRPSERRATRSPFWSPRSISPAPKRCTRSRASR